MVENISKQIEINSIPKDWKVVRLGEKCEFLDSQRVPIKEQDRTKRRGSYPYYGAQGIIDWIDDYIFDGEYILLVEDGENLHSKKLPLAYKVTGKFWVNNHAHVLKVKSNGIIDKYLLYVLNFIDIRTYIVGSAQPKLNQSDAIKIKIPLPPLPEQRRIAEVLGTVDSAIQKVGGAIEKTERLKKGLMQRLLTKGIGHERFKESEIGRIPEEWIIKKIKDVCKVVTGGTPSTSHKEYFGGIIKWLKSGDIKKLYIDDTEEKITQLGIENSNAKIYPAGGVAIALSGRGLTRGRTAIIKVPMACSQSVAIMIPNSELVSEFLHYNLSNRYLEIRNLTGHYDRSGLNLSIVGDIDIPLPPLPEQRRIAKILSAADRKLELERRRMEKLERVKKGLMNELLTGKKRVNITE